MKNKILILILSLLIIGVTSMANAQEQTYSDVFKKVNSPKDVKKLSIEEMNILSEDIRKAIIKLRRLWQNRIFERKIEHYKNKKGE